MTAKETEKALLGAFYERNRGSFALALGLCILSAAANLVVSWTLGAVVDAVGGADWGALRRAVVVMAAFVPASLLVETAFQRAKARFVHRGLRQYKERAFAALSRKSISAFTTENTGTYLSALTNDAASVEENYLNRSVLLVYHCLLFCMTLGMMLWYSPLLTLIVIALSALPVAVSVAMGRGLVQRERAVSDENETFTARLKDLLGGFAVIKSFKAEARTVALFGRDNARLEEKKERRRRYAGTLNAVAMIAGAVVQFGIFFVGAVFALRGDITVGTVLIFVNLCNFLIQPIQTVPEYWASRKAARGLVEKLSALVTENAARTGAPVGRELTAGIALKDLTFGYEPDKPILRGATATFEPGKSYAVVGPSGAGKSTLLNLLMGAFPGYTGSLTVDGLELRDADPDSLYDLMGLVNQSVFLFDATLRENITMFADFPDEAVDRAIRMAGLDAVIAERGEDCRCGENGVNLSGGERQRVAIARALLRGSRVLLVDEATSALDNETARRVNDAILDLEGLTRIVVTHRLDAALLDRYDSVLMLKNGAICEQGGFDELMARKGQFYALYTVSNG